MPLEKLQLPEGEIKNLLENFFSGKSVSTQRAYAQDLEDFRRYQGTHGVSEALEDFLSSPHTRANLKAMHYRYLMNERGLKDTTIHRRISMLRALTRHAMEAAHIDWHLQVDAETAPAPKEVRATDPKEVKRLLQHLDDQPDKPIFRRDRLLLMLVAELALKSNQISQLTLADLDLERQELEISGQGSRKISTRLQHCLLRWLEARGPADGSLLTNFDHADKAKGLTTTSIYRILKKMGDQVGQEITPQSLRQGVIKRKAENAPATQEKTKQLLKFSGLQHEKSLQPYRRPKD